MKNSLPLNAPYPLNFYDSIIDVRTPAEYEEDHLPNAINCPILTNEQRVEVGTLYAQDAFLAKKIGAQYVAENLAFHLAHSWQDKPKKWKPLVYCWRGGMRSGTVVHCMQAIGWAAVQLEGGYKKWRQNLLETLQTLPNNLQFHVLLGPTGSGKTELLKTLQELGEQVLDLEGIARHKGSVLGQMNQTPQPSQKAFENLLVQQLHQFKAEQVIWVEAESKKIGRLHIPDVLMQKIRNSKGSVIETPKEARIEHIMAEYNWFYDVPELLHAKLAKLQEFLSKEIWQQWQHLIATQQWHSLVDQLIETHYDPLYHKAQNKNFAWSVQNTIPLNLVKKEQLILAARSLIEKAGN